MNAVCPVALARVICFTALACAATTTTAASSLTNEGTQSVAINDNRRPAGSLDGDVLTLSLRAGRGLHPEEQTCRSDDEASRDGASLIVPALIA